MLYSAWYIAPRVMLWIPSAVSSAAQSPVGRGGEYALIGHSALQLILSFAAVCRRHVTSWGRKRRLSRGFEQWYLFFVLEPFFAALSCKHGTMLRHSGRSIIVPTPLIPLLPLCVPFDPLMAYCPHFTYRCGDDAWWSILEGIVPFTRVRLVRCIAVDPRFWLYWRLAPTTS